MKVKKHNLDTAINEQIELISPIQERQAELEESIAQNQGTIADIEEGMSNLGTDIAGIETSISEINTSISNTNEQVDNLSLKIGDTSTLETENKDDLVSALNEVFQLGNDVKGELINVITSKDSESGLDANSSFDSIIAYLENKGLTDVVKRISHVTPAEPSDLISIEFGENIVEGSNFDNISLVNETDKTTVTTSKFLTGFAEGTAFSENENRILNLLVDEGLIPNRDYKGEIPIEALRDEEGNVVAGAYVFNFRTRSVIAEQGPLDVETNFDGDNLYVSWNKPSNIDLTKVTIKRSTKSYPISTFDGESVYNNTGQSFVDKNLVDDGTYYYTMILYDSIRESNNKTRFKVTVKNVQKLIVTPEVSTGELSRIINNMPDTDVVEVLFTDGEYLAYEPLKITRSNVSLRGSENTVLTQNRIDSGIVYQAVITVVGSSTAPLHNITIKNITVNGNRGFNTGLPHCIYVSNVGKNTETEKLMGVKIEGCRLESAIYNGVSAYSIFNSTISNNQILDGLNTGVYISEGKGVNIKNNIIEGAIGTETVYGIEALNSSNIIVTSNNIKNFKNGGILINVSNNIVVSNNKTFNNDIGLFFFESENGTISGNSAEVCSLYPLYVSASKNLTITGNTLLTGQSALNVFTSEGIVATGNYIANSTLYGMEWNEVTNGIIGANIVNTQLSYDVVIFGATRRNNIFITNIYKTYYSDSTAGTLSLYNSTLR